MEMDDTSMVFRIKKTLLQMLRDRGYKVSESELTMPLEEFKASYNNK